MASTNEVHESVKALYTINVFWFLDIHQSASQTKPTVCYTIRVPSAELILLLDLKSRFVDLASLEVTDFLVETNHSTSWIQIGG